MDFANRTEVRAWLATKSSEVANAFALRLALRALPVLAVEFKGNKSRIGSETVASIVLPVFRTMIWLWAGANSPGRNTNSLSSFGAEAASLASARDAARDDSATAFLIAAASAALGAYGGNASAASAAEAYICAAKSSAAVTGGPGRILVRAAVASDAATIDNGISLAEFLHRPIWPDGIPSWAKNDWKKLKIALIALDENWKNWTEWYDARLEGRPMNEPFDFTHAKIPNENWFKYSSNAPIEHSISDTSIRGPVESRQGNSSNIDRLETLRDMGRHEEALRAYESAIERFPVDLVGYNGRAEVLREMGRHEEALRAYESASERFPGDAIAYSGRAEVLWEMGRLDEALKAYESIVERFPTDIVAHNRRAELLRELGRLEDALSKFESVVPPPSGAIPAPERRAFQFISRVDGPIDLAASSLPGEHLLGGPGQQEDYIELRAKAAELSALGSNRLGRLYNPINRFLGLGKDIDQVRSKLFWSRINTLRIVLESHDQANAAENRNIEPDERRLEPTVASLLKDLVETINVFVVGDPSLMELDAVRPGPQETEAAKEEISVVAPMIDDLVNNPNVATESAREVLSEQANNMKIADESLPGRQTAEFGRRSIQNFVGELLRRAYVPVQALSRMAKSETGIAWKGVREGAYRAIGAGLITGAATDLVGVTNFSGAIIRFVIRHAHTLIAYVTKAFQNPTLVEIINWIARYGS